jgi:hypothetical protein
MYRAHAISSFVPAPLCRLLSPSYGDPVDPRLLAAFRNQVTALNRGLTLFDTPIEPIRIPFEQGSMSGYLLPAHAYEREVRPLLICANGYDGAITDMYFATAVAASRRGYHCLVFDGPRSGGDAIRAKNPTTSRLGEGDRCGRRLCRGAANCRSGANRSKRLESRRSSCTRAASAEPRIAALIADPATWSIAGGLRAAAIHMLGISTEAASNLGNRDDNAISRMDEFICRRRDLNWKVGQRGFWVRGVKNLREYLGSTELFTMDGRAEYIRCPTLLTMAENDSLGTTDREEDIPPPHSQKSRLCDHTLLLTPLLRKLITSKRASGPFVGSNPT